MRRLWAAAAGLVIVGGVAIGADRLYENHLTSGVRALLLAASDEHATPAEVQNDIAQARAEMRTSKDHEVFGEFEEGINLIEAAKLQRHQSMATPSTLDPTACGGMSNFYIRLESQYLDNGMDVPANVKAEAQAEEAKDKPCADQMKKDESSQESIDAKGRGLVNSARETLGLQPLPIGN